MDPSIATALQNAYQHIKAGKPALAQAILIPIVRDNPDIAEAWYLLGFALIDAEKRLYAFQQVLRIDPSHQAAQRQIARLSVPRPHSASMDIPTSPFTVMPDIDMAALAASQASEIVTIPQPEDARPADEPALPAEAEPEEEQPPQKKRRPWLVWALAGGAVVVIALVGIALWVLNNQPPAAAPVPSPVAATASPTAVPTPRPTASPTPLYIPVFRGSACPFDVPLGTRVRCGRVRVPQDRGKNLTDLIDLPVVIYQSSAPKAGVLMFLQGGPGAESLDWSLSYFKDYVTPILRDYDMIFFDPRGTGRSSPALDCPELNPVFMDAYFQNRSVDDAYKEFGAAWGKCHDRFIAQGIDPAAFNTTQSAADVRDIVQALGYEKVNLLGISYGTRLGLTVMRDYPEIVRAAVLDSVVPMDGKMFNRTAADAQYALNEVFSNCAKSPRCNAAYPNLASVFNNLVTRFDKAPVTIRARDPGTGFTIDVKANGVDLLGAVVSGLRQSDLVSVVPKAIYDIQHGDYTFLSFALGVPGGEFNTIGMGTYFATVCPEQVYASTPQQMDADLNISPLFKKYSLAGLFGSTQNLFDLCHAWGAAQQDPRDTQPVKANIPTLIVSGQYDPTTPVATGQMVADDLPDHYFYTIPGMGHGATIDNDCSFAIMMAFLKDPGQAPDSACLAAQAFDFFIPYDGRTPVDVVTLTDNTLGLRGVVPAHWRKAILSSTYYRRAYLFDPTLVDFEVFSASKTAALADLAGSFEGSHLDTPPAKAGTRSVNGLVWSIYQSKFNGEPVLIGLAQIGSGKTVMLIMVVSAPEREAYLSGLFDPMLDALVPMK